VDDGLTAADRDNIRAVLAATSRFESLSEWLSGTLEVIERRLGFARSSLLLVLSAPPPGVRRAYAGVDRGHDGAVLAEYFERWADSDPFATAAARALFQSHGFARTAALYPQLDPARRRFVDEFLRGIDIADQLSLRLPGSSVTDGYLTIHAAEPIGEASVAALLALAPGLSPQLSAYLPRGLPGQLSGRAREVAELVALGLGNREIATVLNVREDTIKKHLYRAMAKLGMQRRTQLAVSWTTGQILALPAAQGPVRAATAQGAGTPRGTVTAGPP
jgi:DNA-binding CsgD family transcriptional regulator